MPLAPKLFESMHNTNGKPARVANGSWNTRYRPYPSSCKYFDDALHDKFQGDLYVASSGNDGYNEKAVKSIDKTIGNPASCKNTLAGKYVVDFLYRIEVKFVTLSSWSKA